MELLTTARRAGKTIAAAVEKALAETSAAMPDMGGLDHRRIENFVRRNVNRTKGVPYRSAMYQRVEGDTVHYLHATKGWKKRRAFV
jgi:hypothetical protein